MSLKTWLPLILCLVIVVNMQCSVIKTKGADEKKAENNPVGPVVVANDDVTKPSETKPEVADDEDGLGNRFGIGSFNCQSGLKRRGPVCV